MSPKPPRVAYVQRVRTARGVKLYFRKDGHREPLSSADGSDELRQEVAAILAKLQEVALAETPLPGTVGGALSAYRRSADFLSLAASTKSEYGRLLDEITGDGGDVLLQDVDEGWISALRDAWARRGHRAASLRLQMLVNGLTPAVLDGRIAINPFARLKRVKAPHDRKEPNPVWEDAEVMGVIGLALSRNMPGLARAIAIGRWGGFRRGTICNIPLHARTVGHTDDGKTYRRLFWLTEKRRVLCDKPEDPRLTEFLDSTPNRALTIAYNRRGGRWQERQLNQAVDRLLARLVDDGVVRPGLTIHGLRHSRGVELAEAGASDSEIMSQLEHATERAAKIYRRQARRRRLAASAQSKVETMLAKRARSAADGEGT